MTNALTAWPSTLPESTIVAYSSNTRRNRSGIPKLLQPPIPPDAETIRRLNELATKSPFCTLHRVKKHELL